MILSCGEALIDFIPMESQGSFQAHNGGSIYNVAIALGRMECAVGFLGGLSTDFFGEGLIQGLQDSGVDVSYVMRSDRSSTLAFVRIQDNEPEYVFVDEMSAGRRIEEADLPNLTNDVTALHFGSISLIHDPAGATWMALAKRNHGKRIISFDPNIRPGQIKDRENYLRRFEAMIDIADIVKLSDADLNWIAPGASIDALVSSWLERGVKVLVVTRGANGATLYCGATVYRAASKRACDPYDVDIADTIGAGDTFMAGILAYLEQHNMLTVSQSADWDEGLLVGAVAYAGQAASITVSRPGANPPWKHEISR